LIQGDLTAIARFARPGGVFGRGQQLGRRDSVGGTSVPSVVSGRNGEALAFWAQDGMQARQFVTAFRPAGGAFGPLVRLTSGTQPNADSVDAGFTGAGDVVLAWPTERGGMRVRTRFADGHWSSIEQIPTTPNPLAPRLAVAASGAVTMTWAQDSRDGPGDEIMVATRPPGGRFDAPRRVAQTLFSEAGPMIAQNDGGDTVLAWTEDDRLVTGRNPSVHAMFRSGFGGAFGSVTGVSHTPSPAVLSAVSVAPDGGIIFAWRQGRHGVAARTRTPAGQLLPAYLLTQRLHRITAASAVATGPGVVAWFSPAATGHAISRLQTATATATGSFGKPHTWWSGHIGNLSYVPYLLAVDGGVLIVTPTGQILRSGPSK